MDLIQMLAFDHWANSESLRSIPSDNARQAVLVFAHIIAIQEFWAARVLGEEPGNAWPEFDLDTASHRLNIIHKRWVDILSELHQPESQIFEYVTSAGASTRNTYLEVVLELLCHGAHHRG